MKKYDKVLKSNRGSSWHEEIVLSSTFATSTEVKEMMVQVENLVTEHIEDGNRKKAT